jgi:nitrile hydratase accessory protein
LTDRNFPILPDQPRSGSEPLFRAPWEAQAFAMAVSLHQQGLFSWSEWADTLATQIAAAQSAGDADLGDTYYHHWLAALEKLVAAKAGSSLEELARYRTAWRRAAERTPHGEPVELQAQDL